MFGLHGAIGAGVKAVTSVAFGKSHGWGNKWGGSKWGRDDDDRDDDKGHDHGGSSCGDDNDGGDCNSAAPGVDISIPAEADKVLLVIENDDDNDDAYDDYVRIAAADVNDPSNLDDYIAAAEEQYAARGDDLESCGEVKKIVVEDADGKVIKVLYKADDGTFTDTDPALDDDSDDSSDDEPKDNDDDDDRSCGGLFKFGHHGRGHDRDDRDDDDDDDHGHGHGGHHGFC